MVIDGALITLTGQGMDVGYESGLENKEPKAKKDKVKTGRVVSHLNRGGSRYFANFSLPLLFRRSRRKH